jgi:hypothetical protein
MYTVTIFRQPLALKTRSMICRAAITFVARSGTPLQCGHVSLAAT